MESGKKSNGTDAIALLKADHRKVEELFGKYEKSKNDGVKSRLAEDICLELSVHATIEEELFYPAVKDAVEEDIYHEAYVEHDGAKVLIAELMKGDVADEFYDAKVTVLSEMIKHHVKEEEQPGGLFAQARKGDTDFVALGQAMKARKQELVANMKNSGVPKPTTRSMTGVDLNRSQPVA